MLHLPQNKRWSDLSTRQRSGIAIMTAIQVSLLVAALMDIRRRSADQINGNKRWWTVFAFVNYIGPISYFLFGRKRG
jgi:hypothetical protein